MKLSAIIQSVFSLFDECIPLHDAKIEQVGNYISFQGMRILDAKHRQLDFTIYIAKYSFNEDTVATLGVCDCLLEKIQINRVYPSSLKSIVESKGLKLTSIKDGLYVYALEISLKVEL